MTLKELKQKMLKDYLERNMSKLDDNIEIGIKESIFICRLISSLQQEQSGIFGKVKEFIWHKNNKYIQKNCNLDFLRTHSDPRFFFIS